MMRWVYRLMVGAVALAGAAVFTVLLAASIAFFKTDDSMWARMLLWGDADVADMHRFPARAIANTPGDPWLFEAPTDPAAYDSLWAPFVSRSSQGEEEVAFDLLLERTQTEAFLVLLGDTLLTERYFHGATAESLHTSFSAAKSLLSLLVGGAIRDGSIPSVESSVTDFVPELAQRDERFNAITLRHLMTMSAGLAYEQRPAWGDPGRTYYGPDLRKVAVTPRWDARPGERFLYNNYNPLIVGLVLERATGESASAYFERQIWQRLGAAGPASWSLDREWSGFEKMESGFNARADDYARLGLLMLQGGRRGSDQIIPPGWVGRATQVDSVSSPNAAYQYFWWTNADETRPAFWAEGRFGQFVWVSPRDSLIVVRLGTDDGDLNWPSVFARLAKRLRGEAP